MKDLLKDTMIMALPHREWSCDAIDYRVKLQPMPGELENKNHTFFIIEDRYEFLHYPDSRTVLAKNLCQRYPSIPAKRMHLIFHCRNIDCAHGVEIQVFDFYRNDNRQAILQKTPTNYSNSAAFASICMF